MPMTSQSLSCVLPWLSSFGPFQSLEEYEFDVFDAGFCIEVDVWVTTFESAVFVGWLSVTAGCGAGAEFTTTGAGCWLTGSCC